MFKLPSQALIVKSHAVIPFEDEKGFHIVHTHGGPQDGGAK
jgi:hypothetical protein